MICYPWQFEHIKQQSSKPETDSISDRDKVEIMNHSNVIFYDDGDSPIILVRKSLSADELTNMFFSALWTKVHSGSFTKEEMQDAVLKHLPSLFDVLELEDNRDKIIEDQKTTIETLQYALSKLSGKEVKQ